MTLRHVSRLLPAALAVIGLTGCGPAGAPATPALADLSVALIPRGGPTPPADPPDACWAGDVTPAVLETVTEQVIVSPERRNPDGVVTSPAVFRTETRQRIVADRRDVWFQTLCEDELTLDVVSTLQRALKARGLFPYPLTGQMDDPTRNAIRAWQRPRGLDSDVLARISAQALGVVAVGRTP